MLEDSRAYVVIFVQSCYLYHTVNYLRGVIKYRNYIYCHF